MVTPTKPVPAAADPLAADVPPGQVRCLRCLWPFASVNPRTNRICPKCAGKDVNLSRREAGGGYRVCPQ